MESEKTVVVINDQLGEMAWAFREVGFNVLCDALTDEKCIEIAKCNMHITVLKLEEEGYLEFPRASLLAGKLEEKIYPFVKKDNYYKNDYINQNILGYIEKN